MNGHSLIPAVYEQLLSHAVHEIKGGNKKNEKIIKYFAPFVLAGGGRFVRRVDSLDEAVDIVLLPIGFCVQGGVPLWKGGSISIDRRLRHGRLLGLPKANDGKELISQLRKNGYRPVRECRRWILFRRPQRWWELGEIRRKEESDITSIATAARLKKDWPLLVEICPRLLDSMDPSRTKAKVFAAFMEALWKLHRYDTAVAAFAEHHQALDKYNQSDCASHAFAVYCKSLLRLRRKDDVVAAVDAARRHYLKHPDVAASCQAALIEGDPLTAIAYGQHAIAHAERNKARYLGQLLYAAGRVQRNEADAVKGLAAGWRRVKSSADKDLPLAGYLDAATASADGDHALAMKHLNREFVRQGLAPVTLRDGAKAPSADVLTVSAVPPRTTDGPLVTVLMPAFNAEAHIDTAIASVLDQTHGHLELLVIDDCSVDSTLARALAWQKTDQRVRLISLERNAGVYAARNIGLRESRGEYATTHDADDWSHPQRIARQLEAIRESGAVAAISGWIRMSDAGTIQLRSNGCVLHEDLSSLLFSREVFETIGYFDTVRASGDSEYRTRIQYTFGSAGVTSLPRSCLAVGRFHDTSLTAAGPLAYDESGFNPIRGAYWRRFREWQIKRLDAGEIPYMEYPLKFRKFQVPPEIEVSLDEPGYRCW